MKMALLLAFVPALAAPVRYVDLASKPPVDLPIHRSSVKGCNKAFDDFTPKSPDFCYPFPAKVTITAYKPGAGYANASLVVEVSNSGKAPFTLPIAPSPTPVKGEASFLSFTVDLQNIAWSMGIAFAYGDTGFPSSLATIQPGESIEYEIPLEIETLKKTLNKSFGTSVPVVVKLGSSKLRKESNGDFESFTDTNAVPSNVFRIPYPN